MTDYSLEKCNFCRGIRIWQGAYRDNIMTEDVAGTLTANSTGFSNAVILGYMERGTGQHQSNVVYSPEGLSPTLATVHGEAIVKIVVKDE